MDYESLEGLFSRVKGALLESGIPESVAVPSTFWLFASLFSDVLLSAPTLLITGPAIEGGLLLDLLACFARRPLRLAGFSPGTLSALPMEIGPTLLIEAGELDRACWEVLRHTAHRGAFVPRAGELRNVFSAKALSCGAFTNLAQMPEALHVSLPPIVDHFPGLNTDRAEALFREFQPQLLAYRLRNISQVRSSKFDLLGFSSPTRVLARLLGAPLLGNPTLEAELLNLLEDHERALKAAAFTDFKLIVLEAAVQRSHTDFGGRVTVGQINQTAHDILRARGDATEHTDREVGPVLRSFGLQTKERAEGYSLLLDPNSTKNLHRLARQVGVLNLAPVGRCKYCDEIVAEQAPQK
jgi:hypothetical protein